MTEIFVNQTLTLKNVLSYRSIMRVEEVGTVMWQLHRIIKENNASRTGYGITAIHFAEVIEGDEFVDEEIDIPLDREIAVPDNCTFNKEFTIENAVKVRHRGDPQKIIESIEKLVDFLWENKLNSISPLYNAIVNRGRSKDDIDNVIIDLYVKIK